jgi:hypothetical protein
MCPLEQMGFNQLHWYDRNFYGERIKAPETDNANLKAKLAKLDKASEQERGPSC